MSYLLITQDEVTYFISPEKVTPEVETYLKKQQIGIQKYDEVETFLNSFHGENILIDPRKTNYAIYSAIHPKCSIIRGESPVTLLKAIRNEQEIVSIHAAMQRDGVALVRFLKWLEESVSAGKETELSIDKNCMSSGQHNLSTWEKVSTPLQDIKDTEQSCIIRQHRKAM